MIFRVRYSLCHHRCNLTGRRKAVDEFDLVSGVQNIVPVNTPSCLQGIGRISHSVYVIPDNKHTCVIGAAVGISRNLVDFIEVIARLGKGDFAHVCFTRAANGNFFALSAFRIRDRAFRHGRGACQWVACQIRLRRFKDKIIGLRC